MLDSKICNKCGVDKPFSEYHKKKGAKFGLAQTCKKCKKLIDHTYYLNHPEDWKRYKENSKISGKKAECDKRYREEHKEELKLYHKDYYAENSESIKSRARKWVGDNPDKAKNNRKEYKKKAKSSGQLKVWQDTWNKSEKSKNGKRAWKKTEKGKKSVIKENGKRRAKIRAVDTDITTEFLVDLCSRTANCPLCGDKLEEHGRYPKGKHVDHIIPINIGGLHMRNNVRCICAECNLKRPVDGSDILKL